MVVNTSIGYFPAQLFSNLATANTVGWGGLTVTPSGSSNPPMGSGYLPDENFVHACYFTHIAYRDKSKQDLGPSTQMTQKFLNTPTNCYDLHYYEDAGTEAGYALQFGGPGGYCGN
jgi:hypothetical protein